MAIIIYDFEEADLTELHQREWSFIYFCFCLLILVVIMILLSRLEH